MSASEVPVPVRGPYTAGGLFSTHWPLWDIYNKEAAIISEWEWILSVRFRVGDYDEKFDAYPVKITEHANSSSATTITRIYIPAKYRPILRLLQSKLCWHQIALTMPEPLLKAKANINEQTAYAHQKRRYEVFIDGARRNIIYCNSIRQSFFYWIEDNYYGGSDATGKLPKVKPMSREHRCLMFENWMMHELLIKGHIQTQIQFHMADRKQRKEWKSVLDVFNLDWDELGKDIAWYGRKLDGNDPEDLRIIESQRTAKVYPFPIEEEYDQIRRASTKVIKEFFDTLMTSAVNHAAPTRLTAVSYETQNDSRYRKKRSKSLSEEVSDSDMDIDDDEVKGLQDEMTSVIGGVMPWMLQQGAQDADSDEDSDEDSNEDSNEDSEEDRNKDSNKDSDERGKRVSKRLLGHLDDAQDEVEPGDVEGLLDAGPGEEDPDADADGEDEDPDADGEDVVEPEVEHDLSAKRSHSDGLSPLSSITPSIVMNDVEPANDLGNAILDSDEDAKALNAFIELIEAAWDIIYRYSKSNADSIIAQNEIIGHFIDSTSTHKMSAITHLHQIIDDLAASPSDSESIHAARISLNNYISRLKRSEQEVEPEADENERVRNIPDHVNTSGEHHNGAYSINELHPESIERLHSTPSSKRSDVVPPKLHPQKVRRIDLAEMLKGQKRHASARSTLRIAPQVTISSMMSRKQSPAPTLNSKGTAPNSDGNNLVPGSTVGYLDTEFEVGFSQNDRHLPVEGHQDLFDHQQNGWCETEEAQGFPDPLVEDYNDFSLGSDDQQDRNTSEGPLWLPLCEGEETTEEDQTDPPRSQSPRKTVSFKDVPEEHVYDSMMEADELDVKELLNSLSDDPRPKVVTPKKKGVKLAEPPGNLSASAQGQEKLNEEGLFFDMIDNLIYFGNAKKPNISEMDEFFILLDHTIATRKSQVRKYLGLLRDEAKQCYKDADKALLQIVAENKDSKLKWEGWSHEGKNGLVEILEMMVKLRVKKASSKSRSESAS